MKTTLGQQLIYHNFSLGAAKHPENDESMYIVFTDRDNEETHMFEVSYDGLDEYMKLLQETKYSHKLHIASADEMPRG